MYTKSSDNGLLQSQTDFSLGRQYSFTQTNTLQCNDASLVDFTSTTTYTIDGVSSTAITKVHHEGTLNNFKTEFSTKYGTEEAIISVQLKNREAMEGSLSVKSPVQYLRNIDARFSHSGDLDKFTSSAEFQHENTGKLEGTLMYFRQNWRRINSNLVIKTPFNGFEKTKLSVKHTANRNSINSFVDLGYGYDQNIRASVKGSLRPMEVYLSFKSPFNGMENLQATAKTFTSGSKYNSEMTLSREDSTVILQSTIDLESKPMTFDVALSTPFSGLESTKLIVFHKGSPLDFTTSVNVQTSIGSAKSDASFRYVSLSDIDGSFAFISDIRGLENVMFSVKNDRNGNEYKNQMKASWMNGQTIVSDATYSTSESWRITTRKAGLTISTPFSKWRSLNFQGTNEKSSDSVKQSLLAEVNGEKLLDTELAYSEDSKHSMSFVMREPQPMKFHGEAELSDSVKSALVSINLDTSSTEKQAKLETKYVTDSYNQKKEATMKISTPSKSYEIKGSGEMSSYRMFSSWDILIDDSQFFGMDAEHSLIHSQSNYENGKNLKLRFPERSIALSGSYQNRYGKRSVDGSVMWDADRDTSKKIGARASLAPQGDSLKADVSFEIPSIGKDVKLDSEMTLNQGSVVFDGKTEFKYSKDEEKTVVINSKIEEISRGSNKNYTFSFGLRHIFSSVDVQFKSHVGASDEKYSSGIKVDYLTSKRINKNFALMGEIDSLRRQINVEVTSPIKSMTMSGKIESKPYRLSLRNVYDNTKDIDSRITFDPENRLLDAQINFDIDNPANVLHFITKYVNDSAILAEVYRDENSRRITDNLLAVRLNTSRILHTRIHWRPTMIQDLKISGLAKLALTSRQMNAAFSEAAKAVGDELNSKYNLIRQAASDGYRPYAEFMEEIMAEIERNYPSVDITQLRNIVNSYPVEWQNFPGKETYNVYVEVIKELMTLIESRGSKNYAELMDFIEQQFIELSAVIESSMKKYQAAVSKLSGSQLSEYLLSKYNIYSRTLSKIKVPNMASQYTNVIYNTRDQIASRMNGPVLNSLKQAGDQSYQLAKNAYKFWEVEENVKSVMNNIFDMIKKDMEEEFAILKNSISNLQNSRITVFNPKSGEIQMDTYLPVAIPSLKELPKISVAKYVNRFHSYVPKYSNKWGSLSEYIPDSDVSNWIPPFRAVATLNDNHVTTFDGEEYDFSGKCSYVLARDYMDGNFSVIMNFLGKDKKQLIIMTATQKLQIAPNGKLRVDGKIVSTPYRSRDLSMVSEEQSLNVYGRGFTVTYNIPSDQLKLAVSGWYHGKLGGLFGTNNNEVYDDMMTSSRRTVNDVDPFVNSWEVDSKCR